MYLIVDPCVSYLHVIAYCYFSVNTPQFNIQTQGGAAKGIDT
jgi:hypothetical protein